MKPNQQIPKDRIYVTREDSPQIGDVIEYHNDPTFRMLVLTAPKDSPPFDIDGWTRYSWVDALLIGTNEKYPDVEVWWDSQDWFFVARAE